MDVYYKISNTILLSESGYDVNNIIFRVVTDTSTTLETSSVNFDYKCFKSLADETAGMWPFKLRVDGKRVKNVTNWPVDLATFSVADLPIIIVDMLSDTFSIEKNNIEVVMVTPPAE
jgi:hypothetical protein